MTGRSWRFKRFKRFSVIVALVNTDSNLSFQEMEYINFKAKDENANDNEEVVFLDHEDENFIDDSGQEDSQPPRFYRFVNQTRDPVEAVNDDDGYKVDKPDLQPEMFYCIKRERVEFDEFDDSKKCAEKILKSLCSFQGSLKD